MARTIRLREKTRRTERDYSKNHRNFQGLDAGKIMQLKREQDDFDAVVGMYLVYKRSHRQAINPAEAHVAKQKYRQMLLLAAVHLETIEQITFTTFQPTIDVSLRVSVCQCNDLNIIFHII